MSNDDKNANMKVGRVVQHDPSNFFMFYVDSETSGGSKIPVLASPSSSMFSMPAIGAYVLYMDGGTLTKRYIGILNDDPRPWYGAKYNGKILSDANANPGNIMYMDPGDVFVGKHGRMYFNGDVFAHSEYFRSKLYLRDEGHAELRAYDFALATEDYGVSIYTDAHAPENEGDPQNFGDSLTIRRIVSSGVRTYFRLDYTGSATLSIMEGLSRAQFDTNGDISLECGTDGAEVPAPLAYIHLVNRVDGEEPVGSKIVAFAESFSGTFQKAAALTCDSLLHSVAGLNKMTCEAWEAKSTKATLLENETLTVKSMKASWMESSDLTIKTSATCALDIGSTLGISASGAITVTGSTISLNSGEALAYKASLEKLEKAVAALVDKFNTHIHGFVLAAGVLTTILATADSAVPPAIGKTGTEKTVAG